MKKKDLEYIKDTLNYGLFQCDDDLEDKSTHYNKFANSISLVDDELNLLNIDSVSKRYVVSAIELADYENVAICDTITGYVLCHFNNNDTFENRKAIAETVVKNLNGC